MNASFDYVALIPAAGKASRLGLLSHSKEVLPFEGVHHSLAGRTRRAMDCLLDGFQFAGVGKAYVLIRQDKMDIPTCYPSDGLSDLELSYVMVEPTSGVPFTLEKAFELAKGQGVLLGFPDIQFSPIDMFRQLISQQREFQVDLMLAAFPVKNKSKFDLLVLDADQQVTAIVIKPDVTSLEYAWVSAAWSPKFTQFIQQYLDQNRSGQQDGELHMGAVFQAGLNAGLSVGVVKFPEGRVLDIGTPEDLQRVQEFYAEDYSQ